MTQSEVLAILKRVTYKPGWKLSVQPYEYGPTQHIRLRWEFKAQCAVTGEPSLQIYTTHVINPYLYESERQLMHEVRRSVERAEIHEAHEFLKLDGKASFYPH